MHGCQLWDQQIAGLHQQHLVTKMKKTARTPRNWKGGALKPVQFILKQRITSKSTDGFSLIELVVVVAVLAILAAIAIPAFTSVNDKARVSSAKSVLADLVKECAVKLADTTAGITYNSVAPDGYTFGSSGTSGTCAADDTYTLTRKTGINLPNFSIDAATGNKTCTGASSGTNKDLGCTNSTW